MPFELENITDVLAWSIVFTSNIDSLYTNTRKTANIIAGDTCTL